MWTKLKEFYKTHKRICATVIIGIVAFICFCFGSELPFDEAVDKLCKIIGC